MSLRLKPPAARPIGRLFWKFFGLIVLVQMGSDLAMRLMFSARHSVAAMPPHAQSLPIMLEPFEADILASLICAALLAWLLSKPIRSLRSALSEAAGGNLDVRIADRMGPGNDELRDLGAEFDHMLARLNSLIVAQRRLLNDVSHEIRSPMARIQAATGLASQQPEQASALMERIERESVRIDKLTGELLALSRLQADVDHSLNEEIDLRELLSVIIDDAQFEAHAKGRVMQVGDQIDGVVRGNVILLRRAVENVLRNAIKYSPRNGSIAVETKTEAAGLLAVILVRDSGKGVPESDLASIFDPFFRSSTHTRKEGNGLGLAIAQRVIENHGGAISASNMPGGGLCVRIELPALLG